MMSTCAAIFATTAGWRYVFLRTMVPTRIRGTRAASALSVLHDSSIGRSRSGVFGMKWSATHAMSHPVRSRCRHRSTTPDQVCIPMLVNTPKRMSPSSSEWALDGRPAGMPRRRPLVGVADAQHGPLLEWPAGELERQREPRRREPARQGERRQPRQVEGRHVAPREAEFGILRHAERRGRLRRGRPREDVPGLQNLRRRPAEPPPDAPRLDVLRGADEGARQDALAHDVAVELLT